MDHEALPHLIRHVIPDAKRTADDQESIKAFKELITNFTELPSIVDKAMAVMGIDSAIPQSRAFGRDVLSIEIEGPSRPQLTLVDLPGLIQNESKGVTNADVELVREITDRYISQPRTICLAVVSATNDYANQGILTKIRKVDPDGERTLGIITKPDRLPAGSGSESAFLNLARNNDIFFKLGWYVLKNRSFEEGISSFVERNVSEATYFERSNFKGLAKDCVGISDQVFIPHGAHRNHSESKWLSHCRDLQTGLTRSDPAVWADQSEAAITPDTYPNTDPNRDKMNQAYKVLLD
ncbi:hypothetical protein B0A49_12799 [Cryomyces minteri]|uniref:Dynamin GTPase domain-containing protein n=1 Tax=Cryomyces minteri TaxID=331657 RepID=A0A4U0WH57_9PEZI|nr:hypothetical protein B0A49_12799 [Cryomyces minteri]